MIERNDHVRVTSMKETVRGRYDGIDYEFRPSIPVDITHVVARHIFGFGAEDKAASLMRLGWAQSSEMLPKAMERLQNVRFSPSPPLIDGPQPELIDASASERMPNRTADARPLAHGGEAPAVASAAGAEPPRRK